MNKTTIVILGVLSAALAAYYNYNPNLITTDKNKIELELSEVSLSSNNEIITQIAMECNLTQKVKIEDSLKRLKIEESSITNEIFEIIKNLNIEKHKKEAFLQSLKIPFSTIDYRKQTSWHKDFSYSDLAPTEGKFELLSISDSIDFLLLIKEHNVLKLSDYIRDKSITSNSVIDGVSILSNILKMDPKIELGWLKSFIDLGLQPNIADVKTAIDFKHPAETILFLADKSASPKQTIWYQDYAKFNMLTYAVSKSQYDVALQLHERHGLALSVEHDYTVLDFINYSEISEDFYAAELIEIALKEKVMPYNRQTIFAVKDYLKNRELVHLLDQISYLSWTNEDLTVKDINDPKFTTIKRQRFNYLIDRISVLQGEILLLTDSLKNCVKIDTSLSDNPQIDTGQTFFNSTTDSAQTSKATLDPIMQASPEEVILIKEIALALDEADSGNFDGALAIIDRIANQTGDKSLYTGFISLAAIENYPIEVIHDALNKGGKLKDSTIFTFIINSNLEGIELYKLHHDINVVTDQKGRTPLDFAIHRKSSEKIVLKLK
ncbi:hypothetical protein [Pseudoalteromonas xiamenensis]